MKMWMCWQPVAFPVFFAQLVFHVKHLKMLLSIPISFKLRIVIILTTSASVSPGQKVIPIYRPAELENIFGPLVWKV